jgi:hypothetical protein
MGNKIKGMGGGVEGPINWRSEKVSEGFSSCLLDSFCIMDQFSFISDFSDRFEVFPGFSLFVEELGIFVSAKEP